MEPGINQATPLVYNGVMYLGNPGDVIQAIDAASGELIWQYRRNLPPAATFRAIIGASASAASSSTATASTSSPGTMSSSRWSPDRQAGLGDQSRRRLLRHQHHRPDRGRTAW